MEWHKNIASKITIPEFEALNNLYEEQQDFETANTKHIKRHQTGKDLLWQAQLNNRCDKPANVARECPTIEQYNMKVTQATVHMRNLEAESNVPITMRHAITTK